MRDESDQQAFAAEKFREQIAVMQASWNRWLEAIAAVPDETLVQPTTCDLWSVKEVMAHVSAWDVVAAEKIEDIVADINSDDHETTQQFNDRVANEASALSLEDVRRTMRQAHDHLIAALHAEVNRPILILERIESAIADDTYRHYDQHAEQLLAIGSVNG